MKKKEIILLSVVLAAAFSIGIYYFVATRKAKMAGITEQDRKTLSDIKIVKAPTK